MTEIEKLEARISNLEMLTLLLCDALTESFSSLTLNVDAAAEDFFYKQATLGGCKKRGEFVGDPEAD